MNTSYYSKSEVLEQRWRFSPLDFLTILLAISCSLTGIFFLITYQESISPLRDLTPIAEVGQFNQSPQRKIVGTLTWNGVRQKEVLFRGDQILTDEYSKIEVIFLDKTFLNVPPSSLIKLDFNNGEFDIELVKGFLDINLSTGNDKVTIRKGNKKYQLKSKDGQIQVLSGSNDLQFKTLKGDVEIGGKNIKGSIERTQQYEIKEPLQKKIFNPLNEKILALNLRPQNLAVGKKAGAPEVVLSRYADLRKVQRLKIDTNNLEKELNLKLPKPGMYFLGVKEPGAKKFKITPFQVLPYNAPSLLKNNNGQPIEIYEGEKIPLAWTGRKDLPYEIQVKNGDKTETFKVKDNQKLIPIFKTADLSYRVRVSTKNAPWSNWQPQKVIVKPGLVVDKTKTPDLFIKKTTSDSLSLSLNTRHRSQKGFVFEISTDKEFNGIIQKKATKEPSLKWEKMLPGIYYWRATSLESDQKTTGPQKLVIKAPAITVPSSYKENVFTAKEKPTIDFKWNEQLPNSKYILKIQDLENGSQYLYEVSGDNYQVKLPRRGRYKWNVRPESNKEFLFESPELLLNVDLPPPLESPQIEEKQVIYYRYINGVEAYEIELPKYNYAEFYYLEVYKDPQLQNLLFKKAFPNNKGYWVSNRSGKYYYRVRVTDKWGRKSKYSKVGILIFPISPLVKE